MSPSSTLYKIFLSSNVNWLAIWAALNASISILPLNPPRSIALSLAISAGILKPSTNPLPRYVAKLNLSASSPTLIFFAPYIPAKPAIKPIAALLNLLVILFSSSGNAKPVKPPVKPVPNSGPKPFSAVK